jgi:Flp pilus assembly protein TadG
MTVVQRNSNRAKSRGNTIVEATLTLVLFTTILFSLFDFGWVLFFHQTLMHRARTAARYGAVNPADTTAIQNMVLYNSTSGSGSGILGLTSSNVTVNRSGTAGGIDDHIVVKITGYNYRLITLTWAGLHSGQDIIVAMPVEN